MELYTGTQRGNFVVLHKALTDTEGRFRESFPQC